MSCLPDGRSLLAVYVQPRASRTGLVCIHDQAIKLAISSPPVDDAANKAIIAFFSSFFKVARQQLSIHRGHQSRRKLIIIGGLSEEVIRARILEGLQGKDVARKEP
ncbi:MAG: YggU family protein [Proteobacteria bacterium]|nr:YggU family protein [Pseudomonadota bacterium]